MGKSPPLAVQNAGACIAIKPAVEALPDWNTQIQVPWVLLILQYFSWFCVWCLVLVCSFLLSFQMQRSSKGASSGDLALEDPKDLKPKDLEPVKLQGKTVICKA